MADFNTQTATRKGGLNEAAGNVLQAYLNLFTSPDGQLVLEDLETAFLWHEDLDEAFLAELSAIPHPYRAYVIEGHAQVIKRIKAVVAHAQAMKQLEEERDDE